MSAFGFEAQVCDKIDKPMDRQIVECNKSARKTLKTPINHSKIDTIKPTTHCLNSLFETFSSTCSVYSTDIHTPIQTVNSELASKLHLDAQIFDPTCAAFPRQSPGTRHTISTRKPHTDRRLLHTCLFPATCQNRIKADVPRPSLK